MNVPYIKHTKYKRILQSVRFLLANNQTNHVISSKPVDSEQGVSTEQFFSFHFLFNWFSAESTLGGG